MLIKICFHSNNEASRGAAAGGVTVKPTGCGFDPHSRRWNIYLNLYFHFFALVSRLSSALSSATQHAMPPDFGGGWGTECLNTGFPLPTLLSSNSYHINNVYVYNIPTILGGRRFSWVAITQFTQIFTQYTLFQFNLNIYFLNSYASEGVVWIRILF